MMVSSLFFTADEVLPIIKICGIMSMSDVDVCLNCAVTTVGLNFYPPSPRYVTGEQARGLRSRLGTQIQSVGVFVRPALEELQQTIHQVGLDAVQIHGVD